MAKHVTLKVTDPHMTGDVVRGWQDTLNRQMRTWNVEYGVELDGDYGVATRDLGATVLFGLGIAQDEMAGGFTPELRIKIRNKTLSAAERARFVARAPWRAKLRKRHALGGSVSTPLAKIITHSNGWSGPRGHDGVDLICPTKAVGHAICDGTIIRVQANDWWGKGAPANLTVKHAGDGIVVLRCTVDIGPFRKGMNFCYGHAEGATVKVGQHVKAGEPICHAGFANATHFHFMVNSRDDDRGVGDRDPWPFVAYAIKHG
jgi:murein DD-endopeptidase MepM/ murein hydrolase activator NlpD